MPLPSHSTAEHLAEVFGRCQEEIIDEWRSQAGELLRGRHLDGAGIPPGMLATVFGKRVTDPTKEGTGFGLAIVKRSVEAHGGTAKAESIHGAGATFAFTLPGPREN